MGVNVNDYKSFDQLAQEIRGLNDKWKSATSKANKEMTFAGIQRQMQSLRFFISNERRELDRELNKLRELWSGKVMAERGAELIKAFDEMVLNAVEATKQDIAELSSRKLEKIGNMLATAPTEAQLRLLSALNMRGDLDSLEVHHILPVFFDNYHAMKVLKTISEENGIVLNLPVQLDCRTLFDGLNEATDYLMGACDELAKKSKDIHISYHAFFTSNPKEKDKQYDPLYQQYIDLLDTTPQLQECQTQKDHLSRNEEARVDWYLREISTLDPTEPGDYTAILKRVSDVMEQHPEMVGLLKLSKYKGYVEEVEKANAKVNTENIAEGNE